MRKSSGIAFAPMRVGGGEIPFPAPRRILRRAAVPVPPRRMDEGPPDTAGNLGAVLGCLAGLVFVVFLCIPVLFVWAWSGAHCEPVPQCRRAAETMLAVELAIVALLALLLGLGVRAWVNWWRIRRFDPERAGKPPIWAIVAVPILVALALWVGASIW
jgi:hypothetical protein